MKAALAWRACALAGLGWLLAPGAAMAAGGGPATVAAPAVAPVATRAAPAAVVQWDWAAPNLPDVEVFDQRGRKLRFARDLLAGRTVVVSFVFTSCSSICSPISAGLGAVQQQLGARLGQDIHLVSITIDPLTDTPQVLAQYSAKFDARPGWTFVTGSPANIERILKAFGLPLGGDLSEHSPYLFVGNEGARAWTRVHGLSDPRTVTSTLVQAAARRPQGGR